MVTLMLGLPYSFCFSI